MRNLTENTTELGSVGGLVNYLKKQSGKEHDALSGEVALKLIIELLPIAFGVQRFLLTPMIDALQRISDAANFSKVSKVVLSEPVIAVEKELIERAYLENSARSSVLREKMLTAEQISKVLGSKSKNRRQLAAGLRKRSELIGIEHLGRYLYPMFQFDIENKTIRQVVRKINRASGANEDPWGVASWWITPSEFLSGRAPKDLLGTGEEKRVLELSSLEIEASG